MHVFMVFELMQQTLLDVLQQAPGGKLDRETVRLIVYQMVKALDHMHSLNVSFSFDQSIDKGCSQRY